MPVSNARRAALGLSALVFATLFGGYVWLNVPPRPAQADPVPPVASPTPAVVAAEPTVDPYVLFPPRVPAPVGDQKKVLLQQLGMT